MLYSSSRTSKSLPLDRLAKPDKVDCLKFDKKPRSERFRIALYSIKDVFDSPICGSNNFVTIWANVPVAEAKKKSTQAKTTSA